MLSRDFRRRGVTIDLRPRRDRLRRRVTHRRVGTLSCRHRHVEGGAFARMPLQYRLWPSVGDDCVVAAQVVALVD